MDINQVKLLLTKYFDGETTLEEERMLQGYFSDETEIPDELITYRQQFMLLSSSARTEYDTGKLDLRISEMIDNLDAAMPEQGRSKALFRYLAAASIILMLGVSGILIYQARSNAVRDTYSDPQIAYQEAQRALMYVSQKMNKGIDPLSNVSKINAGTEQLKVLQKMDESMGMLNLVSIINRSSNLKK
ncbi:MAG: hypothetical protein JW830_15290 [Bacteroidales bacterium]|nr:hypothetical protein [Bacteroidales bacterium]